MGRRYLSRHICRCSANQGSGVLALLEGVVSVAKKTSSRINRQAETLSNSSRHLRELIGARPTMARRGCTEAVVEQNSPSRLRLCVPRMEQSQRILSNSFVLSVYLFNEASRRHQRVSQLLTMRRFGAMNNLPRDNQAGFGAGRANPTAGLNRQDL